MMQSTNARRSRMRIATLLIGSGLMGLVLFGLAAPALAQDQSAATSSDAIFARKTVMDTISEKMDALEAASAANRAIDLAAAHEQADALSVLLLAFPHMFPAATNQWKPNVEKDPAVDTYAAPELWTKFPDFYKRAGDASKMAYTASRPPGRLSSRPRSKNCAAPATAATPSIRRPTEPRGFSPRLASFWRPLAGSSGGRWSGADDDAKTSRASCT